MAHIIDAGSLNKSAATVPPLARADWASQLDIYKLARMGNRDCQRRWNELCSYPPSAGTVRLIVKVEAEEREQDRQAGEQITDLITKAERGGAVPAWLAELQHSCDPAERELAEREIAKRRGNR